MKKQHYPQKAFYSKLTDQQIEDEEYEFAQDVWQKFNIRTLGEYADLYLRVDVCLLAIIFENFRATSHKLYKLDPANYYNIIIQHQAYLLTLC